MDEAKVKRVNRVLFDYLSGYLMMTGSETKRVKDLMPEYSLVDYLYFDPLNIVFDSLNLVEVVMALEEEFEVEMPDEVCEKVKTVGDLQRYFAGDD